MVIDNIRRTLRRLIGDRRGAAMTEYLIIVGLVALFCIVAYDKFGKKISSKVDEQMNKMNDIR
jgi:Flp pilus assembly pilin Flp